MPFLLVFLTDILFDQISEGYVQTDDNFIDNEGWNINYTIIIYASVML